MAASLPNAMRTFAFVSCALLLALVVAGCGSSDERGGDRATDGETRASTQSIDRAEVERFAGIELPARIDDLQASKVPGPLDTSITARFTIPPEALAGLRSLISEPLEEGYRTVGDRPKLGWKVEDSKRFLGASDIVKGVGRNVLVDLDQPSRPVVYLVASTVG